MATSEIESREERVALRSLEGAEQCMLSGNYGRAFANYLLVLKLTPSRKPAIKVNFALALSEWGQELADGSRLDDLFMCYQQACELFPECEAMHNCMGTQLFRLGYIDEAASCFRRALRLDPDFLGARDNLDNVCSHLVERWHFRMLNDLQRNLRYRDALHCAISAGHSSVLDIGTGTGLLGLFAAEGGAKVVHGCEMTKTMYEVSCDVISANQMEDKVFVKHKLSRDLVIPVDVPERVSLVVTETFDAGLLGEHILDTLSHAWKYLLKDKAAAEVPPKVIPAAADVYICAIECRTIRKQNRFIYPGLRYINLSSVNLFCKTSQQNDSTVIDNDNHCAEEEDISVHFFEPYTTERLEALAGGYKKLTKVLKVFSFNFLDPQNIEEYVTGVSKTVNLKIEQQGHVDALAMWFDLHLDADVTLSSAPESDSCWEQAIHPVLPTQEDGLNSLVVETGNAMEILCGCHNNSLNFTCKSIQRTTSKHTRNILSTDTKPEYCRSDTKEACDKLSDSKDSYDDSTIVSVPFTSPDHRKQKYLLERHELEKLNDIDYNTALCDTLRLIQSEVESEGQLLTLMEVTQEVSLLTLQAKQMGWSSVCTTLRDPAHQDLLRFVANENGIDGEEVQFETGDYGDLEGSWKVVVMDVVSSDGCLHQHALEDLALLRVTCMSPSSIVVPNKMAVYGMVIDSQSLLQDSAVIDNDRTLGFYIAEFMNDFQMQTHVNIDLSTLNYQKLSDPFELFTFQLNDPDDHGRIPSYLNQTTSIRVPAVESGQVIAVVYWFDLWLSRDHRICTLDRQLHWKQAAAMQKSKSEVLIGTEMIVKAACKSSCISIEVKSRFD